MYSELQNPTCKVHLLDMKLADAFTIGKNEVISLTGGGGKTNLMFALAQELVSEGRQVITTTTTKLIETEPSLHGSPFVFLDEDEKRLVRLLPEKLAEYGHVTIAAGALPGPGKLSGVSPETVDELAAKAIATLIVEADGAQHRPVKAPSATEPVIPRSTTLVVPVTGMNALGARLTEENVFRPEIVSQITGITMGELLAEESIATLITHKLGIAKGSPTGARIIPLLNKINSHNESAGRIIARIILEKKHPQIRKVVLANVQDAEPVVAVIADPDR
jgi:probable selenium-dependent hydroxylase accessory protein YqeC